MGWSVSPYNNMHLVITALNMAVKLRCPDAGLMCHSDQGSPRGLPERTGTSGHCLQHEQKWQLLRQWSDMESLFATLKAELGEQFKTFGKAKEELFDCIEVFYN